MIYGYARVSTGAQARDGNSLEAQAAALRENGATVVYSDHYTGTTTDRPELRKLMAELKEGDTLVVTKLDRVARSVVHGSTFVEEMMARGVRLHILNMGIMDNTPASKLMRTMFFAFAEFERDMIVERTQEGKEIAKARPGYREGRPRVEVDLSEVEVVRREQMAGRITGAEAARRLGVSRAKYYQLIEA